MRILNFVVSILAFAGMTVSANAQLVFGQSQAGTAVGIQERTQVESFDSRAVQGLEVISPDGEVERAWGFCPGQVVLPRASGWKIRFLFGLLNPSDMHREISRKAKAGQMAVEKNGKAVVKLGGMLALATFSKEKGLYAELDMSAFKRGRFSLQWALEAPLGRERSRVKILSVPIAGNAHDITGFQGGEVVLLMGDIASTDAERVNAYIESKNPANPGTRLSEEAGAPAAADLAVRPPDAQAQDQAGLGVVGAMPTGLVRGDQVYSLIRGEAGKSALTVFTKVDGKLTLTGPSLTHLVNGKRMSVPTLSFVMNEKTDGGTGFTIPVSSDADLANMKFAFTPKGGKAIITTGAEIIRAENKN